MSTPEAAQVAEPGFGSVASAIFFRPADAGETLARRPLGGRTWVALAVILAVALAAAIATLPYMQKDQLEQMRNNQRVPAESVAQFERLAGHPGYKAFMVGMQVVTSVLGILLVSLLLWGGQALMGGRSTFVQTLGIVTFAGLISFGVGAAVRTSLVLAKGSFLSVSTGLGALVGDRPFNDPLRIVLDVFDVFVIWATVSAGLALAKPARLKPGTTVGIALVVFVLLMGVANGLRLLSPR